MRSRIFSYSDLFWLNGKRCGVCGVKFRKRDPKEEIWVSSALDNNKSARIRVAVCGNCLSPHKEEDPAASVKPKKRGRKKLTERACKICGNKFHAKRHDARYCSPRCRQRASRAARNS